MAVSLQNISQVIIDNEIEAVNLEPSSRSHRPMHAVHISLENGLRHGMMSVGSTGEVLLSKQPFATIRSIVKKKNLVWVHT